MRCQRCQFENIPGESRCFRCGSALEGAAITADIHPPRMARWKRPIRSFFRFLRKRSIFPESIARPKVPDSLKVMSGNAFAGVLLSIIPGLAHLLAGRIREVWLWVLAWIIAIFLGVFFFSSAQGFLFLGFAVGIHGWIAYKYALSAEHDEMKEKVVDIIIVLVFFGVLYFGVRMLVFRNYVFGFSSMTVPYQNVQQGDTLLARRDLRGLENIKRGTFVLIPLRGITQGHQNGRVVQIERGEMFVQVVALGGEVVEVIDDAFVVDGRALDKEHFPVPKWLQRRIGPIRIPENAYFVNAEYYNQVNIVMDAAIIRGACEVYIQQVKASAVMRWLPVSKRGFLKAEE